MILGYRLKILRREKGLSQDDLGKLIGVSKVSVSGYEKGTRVPSMEIFLKLLKVFEISADYILGRELNVVCESDDNIKLQLSSSDIQIIRELRTKPILYCEIASDPRRFFTNLTKK